MLTNRFAFQAMGSQNELLLLGDDKYKISNIAHKVMDDVRDIEKRYSRYSEDSIISTINRLAGKKSVKVDQTTAAILNYAHICFQQSDGLFDITSGVLRKVWDYNHHTPPTQQEVKKLLKYIGWQKVKWQEPDIYLPIAGMEIDFGGIGKEYAADRAALICLECGVNNGFINLGGDLRVLGPQADGKPWKIGIRHPRLPGKFITHLPVWQGAVATSGDYERFFIHNGRRYHHLLQPQSGWPGADSCQSVTVIAPLCVVAGSASSVAMLKSETQALSWLQTLGLPHLCVLGDGKMYQKNVEDALS
ncbi:MAG: FAD:protein FMN transferase [Magnetococcales bacterium]|nr:FAD:protein FMN transferase [Magnetococcales bacterium]